MVKVTVTGLYKLVMEREYVEPMLIFNEARTLYKGIKVEGAKHVRVVYEKEDKENVLRCTELPEQMRAMAAFVVKLYYRWQDDNSMRLEHHYGLNAKISDILDISKLTSDKGDEYTFVSIRKIIENYLAE